MRLVLVAMTLSVLVHAQRTVPIDNDQVKVLSVVDPPNRPPGRMHEHKMNRVMIYLDAGEQRITFQDGKVQTLKFGPGEAIWSPASGMHTSQNVSGNAYRIVEIELKGEPKPFTPPALDPAKVHPSGYKVELDNPQVRIVRVKAKPKEKFPLHEHTLNRVVVVLKPQFEIRFSTPGRHTEENQLDEPAERLMVEIK